MTNHQECSFYYLLGNHDSHPDFVTELDRLAFQHANLEWQPHILRLGSCVFLHGDVIDGGLDHQSIDARRRKHEEKPLPMAYRHWLYDAAVQAKLHCLVANVARRHGWVLKKVYRYLAEQGLEAETGIKDVYFGHTHRPLRSVEYRGLRFHNERRIDSGCLIPYYPNTTPRPSDTMNQTAVNSIIETLEQDEPLIWTWLVLFVHIVVTGMLVARIIMSNRSVGATLSWISVMFLLPAIGPIVYLLIGELRLGAKREKLVKGLRSATRRRYHALDRPDLRVDWQGSNEDFEMIARAGHRMFDVPALPAIALNCSVTGKPFLIS